MQIHGGSSVCACVCQALGMPNFINRYRALPRWARYGVLACMGMVAGLGQAPQDLWPATLLALAVLFGLHPTHETPRKAALATFAFGVGYFAFALRWIVEPFLVDAAVYGWMAPFALLFMAVGAGAFWGVFGYVAARIRPQSVFVLGLAIAWAEVTRSLVFTGFPWALLGHIWVPTPLAQLAAYGGPHMLTLLTLIVGVAIAAVFRRAWRTGGAIIAIIALSGAWFGAQPPLAVDPAAPLVRLVQPNAPQDQKWDVAYRQVFLDRLIALTGQGAVPDIVVWPETSVPYLLNYVLADLGPLADAARGAPLVFGIQRRDDTQRYYNSLVVMGPDGDLRGIYDKRHLVPFGEYIPAGEWLGQFGIRGLAATDGGGFAKGKTDARITLPGIGDAIPLICYEGIFAEEIDTLGDRPRLLLLITNDAWFGQAAGPYQHLAQARLRAIEQGLPMVRVANTGVSAMIDARGRIIQSLNLNTSGAIDVRLPAALAPTPYARFGDWPLILLLSVLTLWCCARVRPDKD